MRLSKTQEAIADFLIDAKYGKTQDEIGEALHLTNKVSLNRTLRKMVAKGLIHRAKRETKTRWAYVYSLSSKGLDGAPEWLPEFEATLLDFCNKGIYQATTLAWLTKIGQDHPDLLERVALLIIKEL